MNQEVIIILGSPNSPTGQLSDISVSRLEQCREIFKKGQLILCTGGWGEHFNTSDKPHAQYCKDYLIRKGLSHEDFLEFCLSENTVDDAVKIKTSLSRLENPQFTVITSDYHLERVQLIFNEILKAYQMDFVGAKSNINEEKLSQLLKHEQKAIAQIKENGLHY